jgi:uncharacterized protein (TIGR02285 family)
MSPRIALFAAALLLARAAGAADRIDWIVTDFPPAHIVSGDDAHAGIIDLEIRYLSEQMPDFTHATRQTSNIRAWTLMKDHDGICVAGALDLPERRQFALYSRHIAMAILAPQLLIRRDQAARFEPFRNAAGEIDLNALAADTSLRAARTIDRPLGPPIEQFTGTAGATQLANLPTSSQAVTMLEKERVDYAFGYANEITYYRSTHPTSAEMMPLRIAGQPRILYTRVACSAGPIGRRAVARIDEVLDRAGTPPPYFAATGRWYDPDDFRELSTQASWTR